MSYEWLSQVGYSLEILHSSFFHLSNDRRHNPPSSASVSELAQVDALPDAHVQASVADGDGERGPHQRRFGVRWHVVVALAGMLIVRFAFAHQAVENGCHVRLYVGVGILVDAQRGRCVLDEQMQQPRFGQGRQIAHYFVGHQVEAPPVGRQGKFFLRYHFFSVLQKFGVRRLSSPFVGGLCANIRQNWLLSGISLRLSFAFWRKKAIFAGRYKSKKKFMEKVVINSYEDFEKLVGQRIGVSDYVELPQERINLFADATLDHQWIHVDTERAKVESPFHSTIAHGYLTLSMLPYLWGQIIEVNNLKMMINYGMEKMKFGQAVLSGQRIRLVADLQSLANLRGVAKAEIKFAIEIEGEKKKALEGVAVFLYYFN